LRLPFGDPVWDEVIVRPNCACHIERKTQSFASHAEAAYTLGCRLEIEGELGLADAIRTGESDQAHIFAFQQGASGRELAFSADQGRQRRCEGTPDAILVQMRFEVGGSVGTWCSRSRSYDGRAS
jgi:hypothetical protein